MPTPGQLAADCRHAAHSTAPHTEAGTTGEPQDLHRSSTSD
jgi:hypothetical protein